jgi:SAM-dependent methyltransferase
VTVSTGSHHNPQEVIQSPNGRTCRSGEVCLICGSSRLSTTASVVSGYLAFKAWNGRPVATRLFECTDCGFRYYERGLTDEEAKAYYDGYRNHAYIRERHSFEPFYTQAAYDKDEAFKISAGRRTELMDALIQAGVTVPASLALDFGGGEGWLIRDLPADRRLVLDISENATVPGVESITNKAELPEQADLVTCAQVLEHVADPLAIIYEIKSMLRDGGAMYLEVPDQIWRQLPVMRPSMSFLSWLCCHPRLLMLWDTYSTVFRVLLKILPPMGLVPMREHINFFTLEALRQLAIRAGLTIHAEGTNAGGFYLVATKP